MVYKVSKLRADHRKITSRSDKNSEKNIEKLQADHERIMEFKNLHDSLIFSILLIGLGTCRICSHTSINSR